MYDISVYASAADPFFLGPGHSARIQKCIRKYEKSLIFLVIFRHLFVEGTITSKRNDLERLWGSGEEREGPERRAWAGIRCPS